ncbi:hypothetical protein N0V95_002808 [Ascochyta clinopodiicola]|nr:hypothetical protein N0V95_002808 [Ascochyta clinopodiicola]
MAAFRSLTADRQPLQNFEWEASRGQSSKSLDAKSRLSDVKLPLHLFEWSQGSQDGLEVSDISSVSELEAREPATVRVIFAPRDVPVPETVDGLLRLFDQFGIPSAFVAESMQNISQSFAAQKDIDGTTYVWFHFLCKTVSVAEGRIVHQQAVTEDSDEAGQLRTRTQNLSQADFNWLKPGFVLKVRKQQCPPAPPSRTRTSSSDATMATASSEPKVELFCFGAPATLGDRFKRLKDIAICDNLMQDPYRRLASLDKRMANIIQLSFHLVTQGDSRTMQSENQSMKTIAVMTLIFMPLSTVAGIFGTQFIRLDEDAPFRIHVSQDFWLLWVIAAPLTVTVVLIWRVWYHDARGRLTDELPPRGKEPNDASGADNSAAPTPTQSAQHEETVHLQEAVEEAAGAELARSDTEPAHDANPDPDSLPEEHLARTRRNAGNTPTRE